MIVSYFDISPRCIPGICCRVLHGILIAVECRLTGSSLAAHVRDSTGQKVLLPSDAKKCIPHNIYREIAYILYLISGFSRKG